MTRRDLLAAGTAMASSSLAGPAGKQRWPFAPAGLHEWVQITADGFAGPVPGVVFDGSGLESGVPLGGLGTGYFTLEGSGKLGFCSIFNDWVPPKRVFADWLTIASGTRRIPLSASRIQYWGHFPVADLVADFPEIPLQAGIRAYAPFVVGDSALSNTPAAIFEIELRNSSDAALPLSLILRFPKPPAGSTIAVKGAGLAANEREPGVYTLNADLAARSAQRVRFVFAWSAPSWRDSGGEPHHNRYSTRFHDSDDTAAYALKNADGILAKILRWQTVVYGSAAPEWLRDALVQGFYSLAKNSVWIARTRKDEWWSDNGWFTHSESHTGCPIVETMVCRMHGHFALLFFFPELETTTLDAFRHFQLSDGEIPFCFGQPTSMRDPRFHCQHPLNSGQYAQMVYQLYRRTGDHSQLTRFYDSAKRAIRYQYTLDDDDCGLVHEQSHARPGEPWPANQFYDVWPWEGTSSYVAGTWLATLAAGRALAEASGDREFAGECADRLGRAQRSFEQRLWNGSYYRLWSHPAANRVSEVSLANQLMGQWCADVMGVAAVLPPGRVSKALDSIERLNAKATSYGLINGVTPDGKPFDTKIHPAGDFGLNIFVGENLCAAMTFLYQGRQAAGLEMARAMFEAMALKNRSPWNQRCLLNGQTGLPMWGDDYYSNLVIWAVPMALSKQPVGTFANSGLVQQMLHAARL